MTDEQQIRNLVENWLSATKEGNLEAVLELMTDDVVFLAAGQEPMIGKDAYLAMTAECGDRASLLFEGDNEIKEIQVLGDWAYLWQALSVTTRFPDGGPPVTRAGHTLSVFRRENGKWKLCRDANMLSVV